MKYIPFATEPSPVNITKIRKIFEEKSQKGSSVGSSRARGEKDPRDHAAYFTGIQTQAKREVYPSKKIDQAYVNQIKGQFQPRPAQEQLSNQKSKYLYNKYNFSNTTKHQNTPQQHFIKPLEMQSVTESRTRFSRTPKGNATNIIYPVAQSRPT